MCVWVVFLLPVTPQEYQPPGFKEGTSDGITFEKEGVRLTMGEVVTPFHTLKVDVTTERERLERVSYQFGTVYTGDLSVWHCLYLWVISLALFMRVSS